MNSKILLLALFVATISSCTTAYKTGQTPDDVYYSPARPQDEYVRTEKTDDRQYRNSDEYYDDRYLRMKVQNRTRWSDLDDWYYYGNRYSYSSYLNWDNPWTPYTYWNNYYNPYCNHIVIVNPKSSHVYTAPRTFNLNTYNSNSLTNITYINTKGSGSSGTYRAPGNVSSSNNRTNSNSGNFLRNIFNGSNSNTNSSNSSSSSPTRSSSSTSSSSGSSSSGSSSSGGSAPVRRF